MLNPVKSTKVYEAIMEQIKEIDPDYEFITEEEIEKSIKKRRSKF